MGRLEAGLNANTKGDTKGATRPPRSPNGRANDDMANAEMAENVTLAKRDH